MARAPSVQTEPAGKPSLLTVFRTFLKLGLTSFGGPIAHLAYFREEFVTRKKWIDDRVYADLVALCQFTPGPASSKVGIGIGLAQRGLPGAFAAWLAFTAPSAIALILFAYGVEAFAGSMGGGWLHGLKVVAVAVVAQAVWGMAKNLTPDAPRFTLAVAAAIVAIAWPTSAGQVAAIAFGALVGCTVLAAQPDDTHVAMNISVGKSVGAAALALFFALLVGLPAAAAYYDNQSLSLFDSFYRAGSLVFGGGHVVLPLLQSEVVPRGWVSNDAFLAGYGAAQAVPGPLFTFAGYLGALINGWQGALLCLAAIFLPAFLLVIGVLPYWDALRRYRLVRAALGGVNAAVVGLLIAALYNPVWTSGITGPADFALALAAFAALVFWKLPPWLVVLASALCAQALGLSA